MIHRAARAVLLPSTAVSHIGALVWIFVYILPPEVTAAAAATERFQNCEPDPTA